MGKSVYKLFRIDPFKKRIGVLNFSADTPNFALSLQRFTRANRLGHQKLCDVDGKPLMVAADAESDDGLPGFRMRGSNVKTAGLAVLFGTPPEGGGLLPCPVDQEWVERHIVWLTPKECEDEPETEVAGKES